MIPRIYVEGLSKIFNISSEDGVTYISTALKTGLSCTDQSVYYIVATAIDSGRKINSKTISTGDTFIWTRGKLFAISCTHDIDEQIEQIFNHLTQIDQSITEIWNAIDNIQPGGSVTWEQL